MADMNPVIHLEHIPLCRTFEQECDPMVRQVRLEVPRPTLKDPSGDIDRVLAELKSRAASGSDEFNTKRVPLGLLRRISRTLREASFRVTATLARGERDWELIDLQPGEDDGPCLGLGIDIGTTVISLYLVDLARGEAIGKALVENPQIVHGEDVLTRIHFCERDGGLKRLQELIIGCINGTLSEFANAAGVQPGHVYAVSVAGNPAMIHFLLGASPYFLCREPYVPAFSQALQFTAGELGISVFPDAPLYLFPNLGSYFGGDVVAGILASGMYRNEGTSILVDVGTNAEIVIGNRDWFVVCAGAAGPALEGGGAKKGMRALPGAIENVRIDPKTLEPTYDVIGGGRPKGICGSGLIDLVAELYLAGALDPMGRIGDSGRFPRLRTHDGVAGYPLALAALGECENDIVVDELDIRNLLRAKGAMYTALSLLTERLGLGFGDLDSFFVAGSFGEHIHPRHAVTIGMLPDIPLDRYRVLGNSAGLGACLLLVSAGLRAVVEQIREKASYVQLTTDNEFMNRLSAAFFIPHTDKDLFPSVKRHATSVRSVGDSRS